MTVVNPILPTAPTTPVSTEPVKSGDRLSDGMGKDAFLKLMIAQLQHQDPLNPSDNTQFIAQMAQFTSLEQLNNLATAGEKQAQANAVTQAISMIGKTVHWNTKEADGSFTDHSGSVTGVTVEDSKAYLKVGADKVLVSDVTQVA